LTSLDEKSLFKAMKALNILITGATGIVGNELGKALVRKGHRIFVVTRNSEKARLELRFPAALIETDLTHETIKSDLLKDIDVALHLAGENISSGRWTKVRKRRIYDSRVKSMQNLLQSLQENSRLKALITASAVGFYGNRGDESLNEFSARGEGFLSQICQDWEQPVVVAEKQSNWPNLRTVILRFGVVLSPGSGMLEKLLEIFRNGLGGAIGSGKQWISWIQIDDLISILVQAIENENMQGIYNATAPQPETNLSFSKTLAAEFGKRLGPSIPAVALKVTLGEMSEIVLGSQKAYPERLLKMGFTFQYPDLKSAIEKSCALYKLGDSIFTSEQYLPWPLEKVFAFFAEAKNLEDITPPTLNFHIESVSTPEMQEGTKIRYKLKVHGLPVDWLTEIEKWKPNEEFVDNQIKGPYTKWHHTHYFERLGEGTLMKDTVRYRLPMGIVGKVVASQWVKKDIEKIFSHRRQAVLPLLDQH
jgi:uncharacterized protein (TIGR01777 family)